MSSSLKQKIEKIRQYKREHPDATFDDMRRAFQCSYSTISAALRSVGEEGWLGDVIAKEPSPLVQFAMSCPKSFTYIEAQLRWAKKNGKKYVASYLKECMEEMCRVV